MHQADLSSFLHSRLSREKTQHVADTIMAFMEPQTSLDMPESEESESDVEMEADANGICMHIIVHRPAACLQMLTLESNLVAFLRLCLHVCVCACIGPVCVCMQACVRSCMVCMGMYIFLYVHVWVHACMPRVCAQEFKAALRFACVRVRLCVRACMRTCVRSCVRVCLCVCVLVLVRAFPYVHALYVFILMCVGVQVVAPPGSHASGAVNALNKRRGCSTTWRRQCAEDANAQGVGNCSRVKRSCRRIERPANTAFSTACMRAVHGQILGRLLPN